MLEATAKSAANLLDIHPNTAALFKKIHRLINHHGDQEARKVCDGAVALGERYFGGVHKGKRGRRDRGKVVVFGLLKRGGNVYTKRVTDTKATTLTPIITDKIAPTALFIPTVIILAARWTRPLLITTGFITASYLLTGIILLMGLKIFAVRLK